MRRTAIRVFFSFSILLLSLLTSSTVASASTSPRLSSPGHHAYAISSPSNLRASECFFEGTPGDVVYQVTTTWTPVITLSCGTPTYGVIHIDESHPINENGSDDAHVNACMLKIISFGDEVPASQGNVAYQIKRRSNGGTATIVWRTSDYQVVTMYTSDSNNWAACASWEPGQIEE